MINTQIHRVMHLGDIRNLECYIHNWHWLNWFISIPNLLCIKYKLTVEPDMLLIHFSPIHKHDKYQFIISLNIDDARKVVVKIRLKKIHQFCH